MWTVLFALLPGVMARTYIYGSSVLIQLTVCIVAALLAEALILAFRGRPVRATLADNTALVTAVLLSSSLPPYLPAWILIIGVVFAVVIAKQLFGGIGMNAFNPAMVGFVVLVISFPDWVIFWPNPLAPTPSFSESMQFIFWGATVAEDAVTSATPLTVMHTQLDFGLNQNQVRDHVDFQMVTRAEVGLICSWVLGGAWLLYRKVITWHIPVSCLLGLFLIATFFHLIDPSHYPSGWFHLLFGPAVFAAFFIATDPVTAPSSLQARCVYGFCIGIVIYIIRTWGGYPDGIAFAVMLLNSAVPAIDYFYRPKVYGER